MEELGNMAPPEPLNIPSGGDIDMNALNSIFARKTPPDNTIKRIEELEKKLNSADKLETELEKLAARVRDLEVHKDASDKRHDVNETDIADLKKRLATLEATSGAAPVEMPTSANGEVDTGLIMKQIAVVRAEVTNCQRE